MYKYRLVFAKNEEAKFVSHLELMKCVQQTIRRAKLPIIFSEGFNPHQKISFASALAVGMTCEREYMDVEFKNKLETTEIVKDLNSVSPTGIYYLQAKELIEKKPALMSIVSAATYKIKTNKGLKDFSERNIEDYLSQQNIIYSVEKNKKIKIKELRPGILDMKVKQTSINNTFELFLKSGSAGNTRPDDVIRCFFIFMQDNIEYLSIKRIELFKEIQGYYVPLIED
ncbi:MAG: TIGR03936 family radical SAM-associated protein [Clostridia bacterium]